MGRGREDKEGGSRFVNKDDDLVRRTTIGLFFCCSFLQKKEQIDRFIGVKRRYSERNRQFYRQRQIGTRSEQSDRRICAYIAVKSTFYANYSKIASGLEQGS